ncbi:hypothetical protein B0T16DRAFT_223134 [Cercophora newfieldiana]|uniref:Uncharacterized protein n=1 Tax=Cercophora newfieldiana TaxID=92897 RepID=A0AA40CLN0_9PEZI|nr:hypothetical protein B0T16DRAFT_223134 [Cercophora newfieldiana]
MVIKVNVWSDNPTVTMERRQILLGLAISTTLGTVSSQYQVAQPSRAPETPKNRANDLQAPDEPMAQQKKRSCCHTDCLVLPAPKSNIYGCCTMHLSCIIETCTGQKIALSLTGSIYCPRTIAMRDLKNPIRFRHVHGAAWSGVGRRCSPDGEQPSRGKVACQRSSVFISLPSREGVTIESRGWVPARGTDRLLQTWNRSAEKVVSCRNE